MMVDPNPKVASRVPNMHDGLDIAKLERQSLATWGAFLDDVKAEVLASTRRQLLYLLESPETWIPGSMTELNSAKGQLTITFVVELSQPGQILTKSDSWLQQDLQRMKDSLRGRERP